ncbi:membrane protein [Gordonia spumicola]|uniref:Membrane protein n=1 Tax=Gordonia spumicola TaxID=589161 RepID=A0A7I9V4Z0_9ACTN|nr:hypothetical protein [Gordonia spumicola]GEE00100.1 membrane protein [Gordonia spumicola]
MTITSTSVRPAALALSKVPEVTVYFWIIKILATTVGETAADYVNMTLGFGLKSTTVATLGLLVVALAVQIGVRRYIPIVYWVTVLLVSVAGTLVTDNLTDRYGVPLTTSTTVFAVLLVAVFGVWYATDRTLSIHSIHTRRRECFYWAAILVTFALGTAAGDLISEKYALGYPLSLALFAGVIGVVAVGRYVLRLNAVVAFWAAYIVTRPLGASLGDLLTAPKADGGLDLGTNNVTWVFVAVTAILVGYLTVSKVDRIDA